MWTYVTALLAVLVAILLWFVSQRKPQTTADKDAFQKALIDAHEEAQRLEREEAARALKEESDRLAKEAAEQAAKEEADHLAAEAAKEEADRLAAEAAKEEADRLAKEVAEQAAKDEADRLAAEAAEQAAKEEADRLAAEQLAKEEADRLAAEAAEQAVKEESDRLAAEAAEQLAKEEADRLAAEAAEQAAKEEVDRLAAEVAEQAAKEEADRLAKEAAEKLAKEEADRLAKEESSCRIVKQEEEWKFEEEDLWNAWKNDRFRPHSSRHLVINAGSSNVRAGFSDFVNPQYCFPSFVGSDVVSSNKDQCLIGTEMFHRSIIKDKMVRFPIQGGNIVNMVQYEQILQHVTKKYETDSTAITVPFDSQQRKAVVQFLIETLEQKEVCIQQQEQWALNNARVSTGIVVHIGAGSSSITPFYCGHPLRFAASPFSLNGDHLTKIHRALINWDRVEGHHGRVSEHFKNRFADISKRYTQVGSLDVDAKVFDRIIADAESINIHHIEYSQVQHFSPDVSDRCAAALFDEMSNEREGPSLQEQVLQVVRKCPEEIRPLLWQNVVVAGGSTLMLGLPQRLEKELRLVLESEGEHHAASAVVVKSFESSILGGSVGNWLGGANVACLPGAFTSSATYYEHGADIFSYL